MKIKNGKKGKLHESRMLVASAWKFNGIIFLSTYANEANLNETAFVPQSDAHNPRLMEPNSIDCIHEVTLNVFCIFCVLMVYSF